MINRILVVNVNWLGDAIFSTPVFRALRRKYPHARISCLGPKRIQPVMALCDAVDDFIEFDEKSSHKSFFDKWSFVSQLKQQNFDIAFLLHQSWTRALLMHAAGIPERVGYDSKKHGNLLTVKAKEIDEEISHRSDIYLNVIESYGVSVEDRVCKLNPDSAYDLEISEILKNHQLEINQPYFVFHTGGNWDLKQWSESKWSSLIDSLGQVSGKYIILSGAEKDQERVLNIIQNSRYSKIINLTGKTSLYQLIALFKNASLVVSADSGPLHLASSVGARTIGLFGPTRSENTGPRGLGKSFIIQNDVGCNKMPCYYLECPQNVCMETIEVSDVLENIKKLTH